MEYFDHGGKRAVWIIHRRGGKDLTALHQTAKMALERKGNYWHIFPTFKQARKAIWQGITKDGRRILPWAFPEAIIKRSNEQDMFLEFVNGSTWQLIGSDNIEVVGAGPIGVVFSEYALSKPGVWDLIRPMLRENDGWASFITTPRGENHAKEIYDTAKSNAGWYHDLKTLHDTRAYGDPDKVIAEERAEGMPDALIRQEYYCDWTAALVGSVWGDGVEVIEKAGGISDFAHPTDGVFTSWDLGLSDSTSIWMWRPNPAGGLDFIDHYENHGQKIPHYVDILNGKGYEFAEHWIPHDGAAETLAAMNSVEDQLRDAFPGRVRVGPRLSLIDGIQAGRWLLGRPTRFHSSRCKAGLKALRAYHYPWDEETKAFDKKPEHDWSSHTADAFRYAAIVAKYVMLANKKPAPPREPVVGPTDRAWNLDQLFEDQAQDKHGGRRI